MYPPHAGYPAQPGAPGLIQSTTVTIGTDPPKDHIIWSLLSLLYGNPCCMGLAAFIYSIKSRDQKMVGDLAGASRFASTARKFNIAASILGAVLLLILIITFSSIDDDEGHGDY